MKNKYIDLIDQTFDFPQDEFMVVDGNLMFNDIDLMEIIEKYGTPLKITYLPKISSQIQRAKRLFKVAIKPTLLVAVAVKIVSGLLGKVPLQLLHQEFPVCLCGPRGPEKRHPSGNFIGL